MENVEKIDIMKNDNNIYCYSEIGDRVIYQQDTSCDLFLNEFSTTQDLLTVNISQPIKRIIKFYEIFESVPNSYEELDYVDMTVQQKLIMDEFIELIRNK